MVMSLVRAMELKEGRINIQPQTPEEGRDERVLKGRTNSSASSQTSKSINQN
jgi:hypothetical protein